MADIVEYNTAILMLSLLSILMIVLLFIFPLMYVYISFAFFTIAKKTKTPDPWLAWIPVANLFLIARIGKVSVWFPATAILTWFTINLLIFDHASLLFIRTLILPAVFTVPLLPALAIPSQTATNIAANIALQIALTAIGVFMFWNVAEARKKPGWISLLMPVPFVNLAVLGIMAWSDKKNKIL